ncbi:HBL/NHE enterotoxin family protein [Chengkuizengella marina]|uniref:Fibronectin type-III domain-containing protein n=1 Tax=Chengkuizengella marina TaxID=2507566 RepID=A0A6N9Q723_9BACL|nr:HBL/NHE enterotoxin family protein [Chengkuizengella marina]NBI30657.1 hypothetical protein [Chengkuizengella marina]
MKITKKTITATVLALSLAGSSIPYNVFAEEVIPIEVAGEQDSALVDATSQFQNRAQQLIADKLALDIYANTILSQGTIQQVQFTDNTGTLITVPINEHQATAKEHATYWRDDLEPQLIDLNLDIRSYASDFQTYSNLAIDYLDGVYSDDGTPDVDDFKLVMDAIQSDINEKITNVDHTIEQLTSFSGDLTSDSTDLKDDKSILDEFLGANGEDGYAIEQLNQDIENYERQLDSLRDQQLTATLSVAGTGTALLIGGALVLAIAPETSPWIIGGMVAGGVLTATAGTATASIVYGDQINSVRQQYNAAMDELTDLQKQAAGFKIAEQQVSLMVEKIDSAIAALNDVKSTWVTLDYELGDLVNSINKADENVDRLVLLAKADLNNANDKWEEVYRQTDLLAAFGNAQTISDFDEYQFDAPTNLIASITSDDVTLSWDRPTFASEINGDQITYVILLDGQVIKSDLTNTSVVLSGSDAPFGEHTYKVRAFDGVVYSDTVTINITN